MKRGSKLLLLCGVLVVLGAGYAAVRQLSADPDQSEETISLAGPASPQSLAWTDDSGTLTLNNGENGWSYADDSAFPLDQTVPESMTAALSAAAATRQIDTPESLEEYGLDAPVLTITALDEDGTEYSYAFGDVNQLTGEYYLLYNGGEDTIYLVGSDLLDAFSYDLYDMVEMEPLPEFGSVTGLSVAQPEGTLTLRYEEDSSGLSYNPDARWFLEQGDSLLALDYNKVTSLTSAVTGLYWNSCVTHAVDDQELAAWGLDDSAAVVTATYTAAIDEGEETAEEETFVLRLGSTGDEGTYAMLEGSTMVYLIDSETADSLRYASYASLRSDSICSMNWNTVDRLDITLDGTTYTISFDAAETEENGETATGTLYTWDGQELDGTEVENLLSAITGLTATGDASGSGGETQLLSFTFHRNTEDQFAQVTLTLSVWDTSSCLASLTGESSRLVDRSAVTELTEQIQALFAQ